MAAFAGLRRAWNGLTYGLSRRVSLFVSVLLTMFTVTLTTVNIIAEQEVIEERLKRSAHSLTAMLADFASNYLTDLRIDELRVIVQDVQRREEVLYAYVLDSEDSLIVDGEIGDDNLFETIDDPLSREARARGRGFVVIDATGLHAVEPVILDYEKLGTVRLGVSVEQMRRDIAAVRNRNLLLGLAFLALSLLLSLPLVRRITRPLAQLTASTEAASKGQFGQRIDFRTNDEIGTLAAGFNRMLAQLQTSTEQIRHLAYFDSVTELPNRVHFKRLLAEALAESSRSGRRGAVLFLDLDRFKLINDTFGHEAGDRLLRGFALRLKSCLRHTDGVGRVHEDAAAPPSTVARLGGDEFTIVLGRIAGPDDAMRVAERVLRELEQPFRLGDQAVVVGTSIGIALFPDDGIDPDSLLKNADAAMYHAKEEGRNNYQFYSERLSKRTRERVTLERELREALERGEFFLHYQPQVDLVSGRVIGMEALLRWHHPRLGVVSPALFIPLAEETRLIAPIGAWALRQACHKAVSWPILGPDPLRVAVNISAIQLREPDFVDLVGRALTESGLAGHGLELEITETTVMSDANAMTDKLRELKRMGVQLAIDDFGTGHSSLSYLKRFPLDRLKIDRSFINDIASDADDEAIVTAIIAMAHSLKFEVVAEGVETWQQHEFLRQRGCDTMQGYLVSPPLAAEDIAPWLLEWRRRDGRLAPVQAIAG